MADKADSQELKSKAKETSKDAQSDNAAAKDSKDTKNGEKEENEESSEEEELTGLYDKPVVIEGKRERKTTVFLASETPPAISHQPKPLLFEGKGESLGSMERTNYELGRCASLELKPLHKLLYGREGRAMEIKKNIRKFNGFAFEKDSKEYESKKQGLDRFTNDGLKRLCEIFDLDKKGIRNDLLEKVMAFLMLPKSSGRPAPQPKAEKKKKRKRTKKDIEKSKKEKGKSKKKSETVESGDEGDKEGDDEEEEEEEEDKEEPPKKKKKTESSPKKPESPKKTKETKAVKDKEKKETKDKTKAKTKKSDDKVKASKKKEPVAVKITPLKKTSPKKRTPKKEKPAPVDDSSSDEEPLAKKTKKQAPTDGELEKIVKDLLDGADLEQVTMKSVCKQVYDMFPEQDLSSRKDFIKETVRKVIS